MIHFKAVIKKFGEQGEKTGWSYIEVPEEVASKIKPGIQKIIQGKGRLDNYPIDRTSLLPMGGGNFIIPVNATIRKALGKRKGAVINASLEADEREVEINKAFLNVLQMNLWPWNFLIHLHAATGTILVNGLKVQRRKKPKPIV